MRNKSSKIRILLLADEMSYTAETVLQHINAFRNSSKHDVRIYNPKGIINSVSLDFNEFDAVVLHYSICCCSEIYLSKPFRDKFHHYKGIKIQFIQDEYRWINDITDAISYMGINFLYSVTSQETRRCIYAKLNNTKIVDTLTGYVPDWKLPETNKKRTIDVGYRGRPVPYWLGSLGYEKTYIAQRFVDEVRKYDLICDIKWKESDRIYGKAWVDFLSSCKAVLGTESGSSISDFDGSIEREVKEYLNIHPGAEFQDIFRDVLAVYDYNVPVIAISPRVFEAAAVGTGLILFPGEYSGIIHPWRNYIPLRKDFSNMDEVIKHLRDDDFMHNMISQTYSDLVESGKYSFDTFIQTFDDLIEELVKSKKTKPAWRYNIAIFERYILIPPSYLYWLTQFIREGRLPYPLSRLFK